MKKLTHFWGLFLLMGTSPADLPVSYSVNRACAYPALCYLFVCVRVGQIFVARFTAHFWLIFGMNTSHHAQWCGHAPNMCAFLVTRAFSAFKRAVGDFTVWHDQMAFTYLIFRRCQTFVFLQSKTAIQTTGSIFIVSRVKILQVFWSILAAFLRGFSASHFKPGAGFMKPSSGKICPMYC